MISSELCSPRDLKEKLPLSLNAERVIALSRQTIQRILDGVDPRMLVIIGPCSVHDPDACIAYANRLQQLASAVSQTMFIVMRVYVEKPRTSLGWKGYLNDPYLNETYHIQDGIVLTRQLMQRIHAMGLPIASEILNPLSYLYFQDLLSWGSIGARTSESQFHRDIASHLDIPIGIKNTTSGNIRAAAHSIACAHRPQHFIGIQDDSRVGVIASKGNTYAHLVLRGGEKRINYTQKDVIIAEAILSELHLSPRIMIDCAHENAAFNHLNQKKVLNDVLIQKKAGCASIVGVMLESFLEAGNQAMLHDIATLQYGQSITDACLGWPDTEELILSAHQLLLLQS